ncbi:MAG: CHASE3 domain-containing protein [Verrucomicrobiota bacterium]
MNILVGAISALVFMVACISALAYQMAAANRAALALASHAQAVQQAIENGLVCLLDAEAGARGFVLTGDSEYLEPWVTAETDLPGILNEIKSLTTDNPYQQANAVDLEVLSINRLAVLSRAIAIRNEQGLEAVQQLAKSAEGKRLMDKVRDLAVKMKVEEVRLLNIHRAQSEAHFSRVKSASVIGLALSLTLFGLVLLLATRVRRLEKFVTVCAWTQMVKDGDQWISFEEYLQRRFRIQTTHGISHTAAAKMGQELEVITPSHCRDDILSAAVASPPAPIDQTSQST